MISKTKYLLLWLEEREREAIFAAVSMTGPNKVGPERRTLERAVEYAAMIPSKPVTLRIKVISE